MGRRALHERTQPVAYLYIAPAFLLMIVFTLAAMGLSFYVSLHNWDPIRGAGPFVGADNYVRALTDENSVFWLALRNTSMYVAIFSLSKPSCRPFASGSSTCSFITS